MVYRHVLCATKHSFLFFRFHTTEHTWQYSISIISCMQESTHSSNATNATVGLCPMRFSSRGFGLPLWDSENSNVQNCSHEDEGGGWDGCHLTVNAPATNTWHYLEFEVTEPVVIAVEFVISVKGKERNV